MKIRSICALLAATMGLAPAGAVGLGPLAREGATTTARKGFYLTLINPYRTAERFRFYSVGWDDEAPVDRVHIPIRTVLLGAKSQRKLLVVDTGLAPGETHRFRVCAERVEPAGKAMIHARVCSKLTARRVG